MPKLTVDGIEVEVPAGAAVLQAYELLGKLTGLFRFFFLPIISVSVVAQTLAQDTGTRIKQYDRAEIPNSTRMSEPAKARATMNAYSDCLLQYRPKLVEQAVNTFPGSVEYSDSVKKLTYGDCLQYGELRFSASLFRGTLFGALYRAKFKSMKGIPVKVDYSKDVVGQDATAAKKYLAEKEYAQCVVDASRDDARMAVLSFVDSNNEKLAYERLSTHMSACLPVGMSLEFSKTVLSGWLSEAIYRSSSLSAAGK